MCTNVDAWNGSCQDKIVKEGKKKSQMWRDSYEKLSKNNLAWSIGWDVIYGSNQRKNEKMAFGTLRGKNEWIWCYILAHS